MDKRKLLRDSHDIISYILATGLVMVCYFVREGLHVILGPDAPLLAFLFAVILSAWRGGIGPGIFSTVFGGIVGTYFFIEPYHSLLIHDSADGIRILLYFIEGIVFSFAIDRTNRALAKVKASREELEITMKELNQRRKEAEDAIRTKTLYLANLTHEIRTPLNAVVGFCDLLGESKTTDVERLQFLEIVRRNGRFLSRLVDSFLDLSKVETGQLEVDPTDVSLLDLINDLNAMFELKAKLKGVSFSIRVNSDTPKIFVSDGVRLKQILINLISNSLKFTEQGAISIEIDWLPGKSNAVDEIQFLIKDTGIGISQDQQSQLFRPFVQAEKSTYRKFGGTGLGLYLSRKIAELLGGELKLIESEPGKGSSFLLWIRVHKSTKSKISAFRIRHDLKGARALVVDDSKDNQLLTSFLLRTIGIESDFADSGRQALEMALNCEYQFIVMDIQMPDLDGYQTTGTLRKNGFSKPIIAITADATESAKDKARRSGFTKFLTKPLSREELATVIESITI